MEKQVLSVSQINQYIQTLMDNDQRLVNVAVRGEISNYKVYPSGHHYFTVKDETSVLRCVMFRGNAMRLRFRPESGMQVVAMGKISVYPRDGAYQLYCNSLIPDGVGDLYAAFEQLKSKLASQGLFDPMHKKKTPMYPGVIGVVTSSAGAAVHDILRVLRKRYPLTKVRLFPVRVQGIEAPAEIAGAIEYANQHQLVDLLIVGRGGGSIEDLWAFNDELVAHAIYQSEIPVISAVGHEPDVTISDYVADLRAATPSNAAELAVPDQAALRQHLDSVRQGLENVVLRQLRAAKQHYRSLSSSAVLKDPYKTIQVRRERLKLATARLHSVQQNNTARRKHMYVSLTSKLDALSPLKVLTRGYAMVQTDHGDVVRSVQQLHSDDSINITFSDGTVTAKINNVREKSDD